MFITILICTYNRCEIIHELLNDILSQKLDKTFDYEIIIIDNNSKDKTREIIESYFHKFNGKLRYVFEPNQGKSYALNRGIKEAQGDIIACIDDDCRIEETYLQQINQVFKENKTNFGVLGGRILPLWANKNYPIWLNKVFAQSVQTEDGKPNWMKMNFEGPLGILDYGDKSFIIDYKKDEFELIFYGANVVFRKEIFYQYGDFRLDKVICEDAEICMRFFTAGVRGLYLPTLRVYHKIKHKKITPNYYYKRHFFNGIYVKMKEENFLKIFFSIIDDFKCLIKQSFFKKNKFKRIHLLCYISFKIGQMVQIIKKVVKEKRVNFGVSNKIKGSL